MKRTRNPIYPIRTMPGHIAVTAWQRIKKLGLSFTLFAQAQERTTWKF